MAWCLVPKMLHSYKTADGFVSFDRFNDPLNCGLKALPQLGKGPSSVISGCLAMGLIQKTFTVKDQ